MPRPKNLLKVHVNVSREHDARMHELARAHNLSISDVYRAALDYFLAAVKNREAQGTQEVKN